MKHIVRQILMLLGTIALLVSMAGCGHKNSDESKAIAEDKNSEKFDTKAGEKDAQFVVDAISEGYAERLLANAALRKTTDQEVKDVANLLKSEQESSMGHLIKYAGAKAISIPTEATDKDQEKARTIVDEKDFDRKWCEELRDRHRKLIDNFENAALSVSDYELKEWANKMLATIRADHDKIMSCHERLK